MSAAVVRPLGPFARAAREALEGAAPHERARAALLDALAHSSLVTVPEDLEAFRAFAQGSLDLTVRRMLGVNAAELVRERLTHVLWMATTTQAPRRPSSTDDDREPSGEHAVERVPTSSARSSGVTTRAALSDAAMRAVREVHEAKTLPPPAPEPRTRVSSAPTHTVLPRPTPSRSAVTQSAPVAAAGPLEVLVVTLDASLVRSMGKALGDRARVTAIASTVELTRAIGAAHTRVCVVVDVALSSIDMPTFATLSAALPAASRVVLWGTNERQKARLATSFPRAREWIASPGVEPLLDVFGAAR